MQKVSSKNPLHPLIYISIISQSSHFNLRPKPNATLNTKTNRFGIFVSACEICDCCVNVIVNPIISIVSFLVIYFYSYFYNRTMYFSDQHCNSVLDCESVKQTNLFIYYFFYRVNPNHQALNFREILRLMIMIILHLI